MRRLLVARHETRQPRQHIQLERLTCVKTANPIGYAQNVSQTYTDKAETNEPTP